MVKPKRRPPKIEMKITEVQPELPDLPGPYSSLEGALLEAFYRASRGKGAERHGEDKPFHEQDICAELRTFGPTPAIFQIRKKAKELLRLNTTGAQNELLDIIVYAAALYIVLSEEV